MTLIRTLKERLEEKMQRKKFLLVLDDIWGTFGQYWDALRGCSQNVGALKGNTILATSRLKDTLEKLDATCILPVGKLSEQDSWSLFKQCVGENNLSDPTKADLGWTMWRHALSDQGTRRLAKITKLNLSMEKN